MDASKTLVQLHQFLGIDLQIAGKSNVLKFPTGLNLPGINQPTKKNYLIITFMVLFNPLLFAFR